MQPRSSRARRLPVAGVAGLICMLFSGPAAALTIYPWGNPIYSQFIAMCNDGTVFGPYTGPADAMHFGGIACENHGGLADITDISVQTALNSIQTCADPSNMTIGRDEGNGVQPLTPEEFQEIIDQTGGVAQELVGVELMSVVVRGTELLPNPPPVPSPNPIAAIYSDENDDGRFVGGATGCPAPPVPDGTFGAPMHASSGNQAGSVIDLTWDVSTCRASDHHVVFGTLADVAALVVDGGVCSIGTAGNFTWSSVPAGDLWFLVVGNDGLSNEGSWGVDSRGAHRAGEAVSGLCSMIVRDNGGTCP